jgi:hypothetical protein
MVNLSCGLREIHHLILQDMKYNMLAMSAFIKRQKAKLSRCHGDIKPENIILVNGRFKFADPAEAGIEVSVPSNIPTTAMTGGTTTYGTFHCSESQR